MGLVAEISPDVKECIRNQKYYDTASFRTYICELVYNGINLFPHISKYTIKCTNEQGESNIIFSAFNNKCDDDQKPCMGKFFGNDIAFTLSRKDIKELYCNNRHEYFDFDTINTYIILLFMGGSIPKVSTSFEVDTDYVRKQLKFKC